MRLGSKMQPNNKKIVFLLGTFEPAMCGVSDYVRVLRNKLRSKGYLCFCVAINDRYAKPEDFQIVSNLNSEKDFRLSSTLPWSERKNILKLLLDTINPDFISLQYVPHSFDKKGLPYQLIGLLKAVKDDYKWGIMAHELWGGSKKRMRDKGLYILQKWLTLYIIKNINPNIVHVSNHNYQKRLLKEEIKSKILPIFSNIPYSKKPCEGKRSNKIWTFVIFGMISTDWNPYELLENIEKARVKYELESCNFISIGKCGEYGEKLWRELSVASKTIYPYFAFKLMGKISAEEISYHLQSADFGLSRTPSHLVEKSGTIAAMHAHGLPVIINNIHEKDIRWHESLVKDSKYILLDQNFIYNIMNKKNSMKPVDQLEDAAQVFIGDIN